MNYRGGARIGMSSGTWPFGRLILKDGILTISNGMSTCQFRADQVSSITFNNGIGGGIEIQHNVAEYPSKVIFQSMANANQILNELKANGFTPSADPSVIQNDNHIKENRRILKLGASFFKLIPAIAVIVIWNILFFIDFIKKPEEIFGTGTKTALALVFLTSISIILVKPIQDVFLKENRSVEEVRPFLLFLALIAGFMFVFSIIFNAA